MVVKLMQALMSHADELFAMTNSQVMLLVETPSGTRFWSANGKLRNEFDHEGRIKKRSWGMKEIQCETATPPNHAVVDFLSTLKSADKEQPTGKHPPSVPQSPSAEKRARQHSPSSDRSSPDAPVSEGALRKVPPSAPPTNGNTGPPAAGPAFPDLRNLPNFPNINEIMSSFDSLQRSVASQQHPSSSAMSSILPPSSLAPAMSQSIPQAMQPAMSQAMPQPISQFQRPPFAPGQQPLRFNQPPFGAPQGFGGRSGPTGFPPSSSYDPAMPTDDTPVNNDPTFPNKDAERSFIKQELDQLKAIGKVRYSWLEIDKVFLTVRKDSKTYNDVLARISNFEEFKKLKADISM